MNLLEPFCEALCFLRAPVLGPLRETKEIPSETRHGNDTKESRSMRNQQVNEVQTLRAYRPGPV